ncbi:hypothetical protein BKI52_28670 [marine bacterium AO1-C]|nr:hypothetical protein BKI52_28670 [marine bacterium AO1-C]
MKNLEELVTLLEQHFAPFDPNTEAIIHNNAGKLEVFHKQDALKAYETYQGVFERMLATTSQKDLKERGCKILFLKIQYEIQKRELVNAFRSLQALRNGGEGFYFHWANACIGSFLMNEFKYQQSFQERKQELELVVQSLDYDHREVSRITKPYKKELLKEVKKLNSWLGKLWYNTKQHHG